MLSFAVMWQSALRWQAVKLVPRPASMMSSMRAIPFRSGSIPMIANCAPEISMPRRPSANVVVNTTS